jgi:hypothetical protein
MHQGRFPESCPPAPGHTLSYARGPWTHAELDPDQPARIGRRQWLVAVSGVCAGLALAPAWSLLGGAGSQPGPAGGSTEAPPAPGARSAPAWTLALLDAPHQELVAAAGDLERVSFCADPRLVPVFERLLDAILAAPGPEADQAGPCAVRSLGRLGRLDLVAARRARAEVAPGLPLTAAAMAVELQREARELRRERKQ